MTQSPQKPEVRGPDGAFAAARFVVVVSMVIERDGKFLLLKRSPAKDHAPNEWETGSGRVEAGERPEDAVRREVLEETGLRVEVVRPMAAFHFYRGASKEEAIGISYWCKYAEGEVTLSEEHTEFRWVEPVDVSTLTSSTGVAEVINAIAAARSRSYSPSR